jgi:ribosomal protein S18 acetylase RimI-like enzyme
MSLSEGFSIAPLADPSEAEACARMMSETEPWLTLGRSYDASLRILGAPGKEIHVLRAGGILAGFLILDLRGALSGYIQTVCVAPEWRGRGLGSAMIGWAEERIFRQGPNVFLCVSSFNTSARRLYLRLGYEQVGELKDFLIAGSSEILMRKTRGPLSTSC